MKIRLNIIAASSLISAVSFVKLKKNIYQGRGPVRCVKRHRGRRGRPDRIELLVNIDLVRI